MGLVRGLPSSKMPMQQAAIMRPLGLGDECDGGALQLHGDVKARAEIGSFDVAAVAQRVAPQLVVDGGDAGQVIERGGAQGLRCQGSWRLPSKLGQATSECDMAAERPHQSFGRRATIPRGRRP